MVQSGRHLALGDAVESLSTNRYLLGRSLLKRFADSVVPGMITGKVVSIDESGNLVTDIDVSQLSGAPRDANVRIVVDEHETFGLHPAEHDQPEMTLIAIAPEAGSLSISLVGDSANAMLGVAVGASVEVRW